METNKKINRHENVLNFYLTDIGLECGGFLQSMGFETTIMVRSVALRGFDQQMANLVVDEMKQKDIKFLFKCIPVSVTKLPNNKLLVRWRHLDVSKFPT